MTWHSSDALGRRLAFVAVLFASVACGACGSTSTTSANEPSGASTACPDGQAFDATTNACGPIVFAGDCAAGSMPKMGEAACVPVGVDAKACAAGFAPDPSGWGCAPVVADACTGATREALGSTMCVPIGDCDAAFPPANATHIVDASSTANDGRHFRSLSDALAIVPSGSVVAVEAGTYAEPLPVLQKNVDIVGRCPAKVVIAPGPNEQALRVMLPGAKRMVIRGVSIRGALVAISVAAGGVDVEDVVLEKLGGAGLDIWWNGRGIPGDVTFARSVVRDVGGASDTLETAVMAQQAAHIAITDSAVVRSRTSGVYASDTKTRIELTNSVVRATDAGPIEGGIGVWTNDGAAITIERGAILENHRAGVSAFAHSTIALRDSVVSGTKTGKTGTVAGGVVGFDGSTITGERVAIVATEGLGVRVAKDVTATFTDAIIRGQTGTVRATGGDGDFGSGVYVHLGAKLSLANVAVVDNQRAAVELHDDGSSLVATDSLFASTKPSVDAWEGQGGLGAFVGPGTDATIEASAIVGNHLAGVYAADSTSLVVKRTTIRTTVREVAGDRLGHGLLAENVPAVTFEGSEVRRNVGVGLAFSASSAIVFDSWITANAIGIHAQDGSELAEAASPPSAFAPNAVVVGADTRFVGNETKTGSGVVPLPEPLDPLPPSKQ